MANAIGDLFAFKRFRSAGSLDADATVTTLAYELDELLTESELDRARITRVTFAIEGAVDESLQIVHDTPTWVDDEVEVADLLTPLLADGIELAVTSAANAMARAAIVEAAPAHDELVAVLHVGFGTWMFLSQDGRILHSHHGRSGYLSHLSIPGNDRACECGGVT